MNRRMVITAALAFSLGTLPLLAHGQAGGVGAGPPADGPGAGGFGPGLQADGQGAGGRGPGRPGPGGPGGPMGILPGLNRVDLTDAQREQIRAILEQARATGDPGEKVRQAEQALHAAVLADTP